MSQSQQQAQTNPAKRPRRQQQQSQQADFRQLRKRGREIHTELGLGRLLQQQSGPAFNEFVTSIHDLVRQQQQARSGGGGGGTARRASGQQQQQQGRGRGLDAQLGAQYTRATEEGQFPARFLNRIQDARMNLFFDAYNRMFRTRRDTPGLTQQEFQELEGLLFPPSLGDDRWFVIFHFVRAIANTQRAWSTPEGRASAFVDTPAFRWSVNFIRNLTRRTASSAALWDSTQNTQQINALRGTYTRGMQQFLRYLYDTHIRKVVQQQKRRRQGVLPGGGKRGPRGGGGAGGGGGAQQRRQPPPLVPV